VDDNVSTAMTQDDREAGIKESKRHTLADFPSPVWPSYVSIYLLTAQTPDQCCLVMVISHVSLWPSKNCHSSVIAFSRVLRQCQLSLTSPPFVIHRSSCLLHACLHRHFELSICHLPLTCHPLPPSFVLCLLTCLFSTRHWPSPQSQKYSCRQQRSYGA
jgi:hypothetical protein